MSKKEKTAKKIWDKKHNHIFETFALEMEEFSDTGAIPPHADQDLQYSFELLKKRLEQHKLEVSYRFEPGDLSEEGYSGQKNWKDHRFVTRRECRDCSLERTFRRDGKQVYRRKTPYFFYQ